MRARPCPTCRQSPGVERPGGYLFTCWTCWHEPGCGEPVGVGLTYGQALADWNDQVEDVLEERAA